MNADGPELIPCGVAVDDRGRITFANDLDLATAGIRRIYTLANWSQETRRAFHGHKREEKYMFPLAGTMLVCVVEIHDWEWPERNQQVERYVLSADTPAVLRVPPGHANGLRALTDGAAMLVMSTLTIEESKADSHNFSPDRWDPEVWEVQDR